jgi:hypothetical protein
MEEFETRKQDISIDNKIPYHKRLIGSTPKIFGQHQALLPYSPSLQCNIQQQHGQGFKEPHRPQTARCNTKATPFKKSSKAASRPTKAILWLPAHPRPSPTTALPRNHYSRTVQVTQPCHPPYLLQTSSSKDKACSSWGRYEYPRRRGVLSTHSVRHQPPCGYDGA